MCEYTKEKNDVRWTTLEVLTFLREHTASSFYQELDAAIEEHKTLQRDKKQLQEACEIALLALTHKPINPDDVAFVKTAIAKK